MRKVDRGAVSEVEIVGLDVTDDADDLTPDRRCVADREGEAAPDRVVTRPVLVGEPAVAAQSGAFAVLGRLVDGGILTALTTTIVGGVGGYLMRVLKSSYLGTRLSRYYEEQEQRHAARVEDLLRDIRASLAGVSASAPAARYELLDNQ